MGSLFALTLINTFTLFAIGVLLIRSLWSLFTNVTSIESWEIERHATLVRRARAFDGYLDGPNGERIPIKKQEFPYDIGLWSNFRQVFGANPLSWLWTFAHTPSSESGLEFETNGFEDDGIGWPPPDPDRMPRTRMKLEGGVTTHDGYEADVVQRDVVFMRHAGDGQKTNSAQRRKRFHERYTDASTRDDMEPPDDLQVDGEEAWRNSEGERLADFGLDEEAEFYDDDEGNVPLSLKGKGKPA
ncbi:MAG: hypothetical protein GOMPHAMPRED_006809 [Gomphillus americanus]|uniref:Palmitoyltransferase pfa4 n=1 Tax=Gomphillus americanus TaxID=1940652 RepID=A0A8H3I917_9LECA|nr:MAG: hypothetical protein GOMPHAMPRED_006809 [Gomphillus americanus]